MGLVLCDPVPYVRVAVSTEHVMVPGSRMRFDVLHGVLDDGHHRAKLGHVAPKPVERRYKDPLSVQRVFVPESLLVVVRVPEADVGNLRPSRQRMRAL